MDLNNKTIYLDNAATTPLAPEVTEAMHQALLQTNPFWANTSSDHRLGHAAKQEIVRARENIAHILNCDPMALLFTSGATESINQALKGVMRLQKTKRHLITTTIEHKATLQVVHSLMQEGIKATFLKPDAQSQITLEMIQQAITPETALVSLIWVNNETGTILEIEKISAYLRRQKILLHVDATQAIPRMKIDASQIDLISMSAHKCYGPKGVGLLIRNIFPKINLKPLIEGSDAQMGIRAGTLPNHQIIGLAQSLQFLDKNYAEQIEKNRTRHAHILEQFAPLNVQLNGGTNTTPSIMNLYFPNIMNETLMYLLPNICLSAGSACSSENHAPSHVLTELGLTPIAARQSIRLSFGQFTSYEMLETAILQMKYVATFLQSVANGTPAHLTLSVLELDTREFNNTILIQTLINPELVQYDSKNIFENTTTLNLSEKIIFNHQNDENEIKIEILRNGNFLMINACVCGCPYLITLLSMLLKTLRKLQIDEFHSFDIKSYLDKISNQILLPTHKIKLPVILQTLFDQIKKQYIKI